MFRLIRPCQLLARNSVTILRPCSVQATPLGSSQEPRKSFQPASHDNQPSGRLPLGEGARRFGPEMKTEESVLAQFNGLLTSQERQLAKDDSEGERPVIPGLYDLLRGCSDASLLETPATKIAMAQTMMAMLKEKDYGLNVSVYNTLLRLYVTLGHTFVPSQFLAEMKENGVDPNRSQVAPSLKPRFPSSINSLGMEPGDEVRWHLLYHVQGTLSYLIEAYCQQGNISGATKLLEHMKANDIAVIEDIYASLITGHAQNGDMDKAEDVMRLMKDKGHPLSNVTYQAVLCAYAKEGNIKAIARVREQMREERVFSSTMGMVRIIDTLSQYGHGHLIEEVLDTVRNKHWIMEDLRTLSCTLLMRGEFDNAMILVRCLATISGVTTFLGQAVVRGMVLSRRPLGEILDMIKELMSMISKDGIIRFWVLYRDLLSALFEGKLSEGDQRAEDIVTTIKAMKESSFIDKTFTYPVLAHYAKTGNVEGTLDTIALSGSAQYDYYTIKFLVKTLDTAGVEVTDFCRNNPRAEEVLNHLLVYYSDSGNWTSLHKTLRACRDADTLKIGTILRGMSLAIKNGFKRGALPELADVYLALNDLEPRPSLETSIKMTVLKLLRFAPREEQREVYESLLSPLTTAGLPVSPAYNELVTTLSRRNETQQLFKIYDEIKDSPHVQLSSEVQHVIATMSPMRGKTDGGFTQEVGGARQSGDKVNYEQNKHMLPGGIKTYNEMRSRGEMPFYMSMEHLTLSVLKEDFQLALKLREDMLQHGYKLRLLVYNHFIERYARLGDIQNMLAELQNLRDVGLFPNQRTYENLMCGYAEQREPGEIRRLMADVLGADWKVTPAMVSYLMEAYVYSKQLSEALEVVHEFKDVARPQGHALWVLINELVKQGHPQEELTTALDTLRSVPHVTRQNVDDLELEVYVRNGKMDTAKDVIQREGFELKPANFVIHCKKWKYSGLEEHAVQAIQLLRDEGFHLQSADIALALVSAYRVLRDRKGALSLYEEIKGQGGVVNVRFVSVLHSMGITTTPGVPQETSV